MYNIRNFLLLACCIAEIAMIGGYLLISVGFNNEPLAVDRVIIIFLIE